MVRIEKNFLPAMFFDKLKFMLACESFFWHFNPQTVYNKNFKQDDHFMFTHILFTCKEIELKQKQKQSVWLKDFEPIIYYLSEKIKIKKLLRMKLNLYTNQNKVIEHASHTDINTKDQPTPGVTVSIFNFTTCNGGTRIEDKKYPSNENEILIFNNLNKHSGIVQTDTQIRIVLNIATE
tara:strand:- start:73 stop:609 length:537 start_codon:yes stop_codon:yes gene_type:complete